MHVRTKILLTAAIISGTAVLTAAGVKGYQYFFGSKIKVYSVEELTVEDWDETASIYGTVSDDVTQEIRLDSEKAVDTVYVKEGDVVKKDDELLKYDMTMTELDLEAAKINKQLLEAKVTTLNKQIANPKKYLDEEAELFEKNQMEEEGADESESGDSESGAGKSENGDTKNDDPEASKAMSTPAASGKPSIIYLSAQKDTAIPGPFLGGQTESKEDIFRQVDTNIYTQEEISDYVSEKKDELQETKLEISRSTLNISQLEKKLENQTVKSQINGVVHLGTEDSDVFLTVKGDGELSVIGSLSEYALNQVTIGSILQGQDYSTKENFQAEILKISTYPVAETSGGMSENSASYYSYTALIKDDVLASRGDEVEFYLNDEKTKDGIFLEKAFVLSESGKSFVYVADEDGRLQKRYIEVGKIIDGNVVEVKKGLSTEDSIAFPYGKGVKEGAATEFSSTDSLYE